MSDVANITGIKAEIEFTSSKTSLEKVGKDVARSIKENVEAKTPTVGKKLGESIGKVASTAIRRQLISKYPKYRENFVANKTMFDDAIRKQRLQELRSKHYSTTSSGYLRRRAEKQSMYEDLWSKLDNGATVYSRKNIVNNNYIGMAIDGIKSKLKSINPIIEQLKLKLKPLKIFISRLGRIAVYRMIRSAIKSIAQAFKEGSQNLYQWSKLQTSAFGNRFAQSMDKMATASLYLKNSIATITAPVLEALANLIDSLADKIANATDKIARFIAILSGSDSYTKAIKTNKEYAESLNEIKRVLLGFDELNVLSDANGSGASDYAKMFEEVATNGIGTFAANLGISFKEVFCNFDDINIDTFIQRFMVGLNAITGGFIGWKLGGVSGAITGVLAGAGLGFILSTIEFTNDGTLSPDELGALIWGGLGGMIGGVLGFTFTKSVKGAAMGFTIGANLGMIIREIAFPASGSKYMPEEVINLLRSGLIPLLGGVLGFAIAGTAVGGLLGISIGVALSLVIKSVSMSNPNGTLDKVLNVDDGGVLPDSVQSMLNTKTSATYDYANATQKYRLVHARANGGTVPTGDLFIAGESGAELVTHIGGRNTVYNEQQLGSSLAYANQEVVSAILSSASSIMQSIAENKTEVNIGDREIARAASRGSKLTGNSLIQGA